MKLYIDWERLSLYLSRQIAKAEKDNNKSQMKFWRKVYGIMQDYADIEQEPKTGHWIVDGSVDCYLDKVRCHCSECDKKKIFPADYNHVKQEISISYKYPEFIDNYCPNCGSRMSEVSE